MKNLYNATVTRGTIEKLHLYVCKFARGLESYPRVYVLFEKETFAIKSMKKKDLKASLLKSHVIQ